MSDIASKVSNVVFGKSHTDDQDSDYDSRYTTTSNDDSVPRSLPKHGEHEFAPTDHAVSTATTGTSPEARYDDGTTNATTGKQGGGITSYIFGSRTETVTKDENPTTLPYNTDIKKGPVVTYKTTRQLSVSKPKDSETGETEALSAAPPVGSGAGFGSGSGSEDYHASIDESGNKRDANFARGHPTSGVGQHLDDGLAREPSSSTTSTSTSSKKSGILGGLLGGRSESKTNTEPTSTTASNDYATSGTDARTAGLASEGNNEQSLASRDANFAKGHPTNEDLPRDSGTSRRKSSESSSKKSGLLSGLLGGKSFDKTEEEPNSTTAAQTHRLSKTEGTAAPAGVAGATGVAGTTTHNDSTTAYGHGHGHTAQTTQTPAYDSTHKQTTYDDGTFGSKSSKTSGDRGYVGSTDNTGSTKHSHGRSTTGATGTLGDSETQNVSGGGYNGYSSHTGNTDRTTTGSVGQTGTSHPVRDTVAGATAGAAGLVGVDKLNNSDSSNARSSNRTTDTSQNQYTNKSSGQYANNSGSGYAGQATDSYNGAATVGDGKTSGTNPIKKIKKVFGKKNGSSDTDSPVPVADNYAAALEQSSPTAKSGAQAAHNKSASGAHYNTTGTGTAAAAGVGSGAAVGGAGYVGAREAHHDGSKRSDPSVVYGDKSGSNDHEGSHGNKGGYDEERHVPYGDKYNSNASEPKSKESTSNKISSLFPGKGSSGKGSSGSGREGEVDDTSSNARTHNSETTDGSDSKSKDGSSNKITSLLTGKGSSNKGSSGSGREGAADDTSSKARTDNSESTDGSDSKSKDGSSNKISSLFIGKGSSNKGSSGKGSSSSGTADDEDTSSNAGTDNKNASEPKSKESTSNKISSLLPGKGSSGKGGDADDSAGTNSHKGKSSGDEKTSDSGKTSSGSQDGDKLASYEQQGISGVSDKAGSEATAAEWQAAKAAGPMAMAGVGLGYVVSKFTGEPTPSAGLNTAQNQAYNLASTVKEKTGYGSDAGADNSSSTKEGENSESDAAAADGKSNEKGSDHPGFVENAKGKVLDKVHGKGDSTETTQGDHSAEK